MLSSKPMRPLLLRDEEALRRLILAFRREDLLHGPREIDSDTDQRGEVSLEVLAGRG